MKILTILGARPQFIKAGSVSRAIASHNNQVTSLESLVSSEDSKNQKLQTNLYGGGKASENIIKELLRYE
ncbi:hypothetical protein [Aliarcobacter cryaerophilus]|uniref:hypothetical protein n=1 Tax=Aliarcobacter cryaerophilus TaxID=28198 RepID=UPI0021B67D92|nr:hypothetical protein [Aliarcobacter cryaerophilus]MCT7473085.1 hypothetical protein [Aliarcobacter cryaerophilus]